jgi:hypothetical protein
VALFAVGDYERISKYHINKVLVDISETEFFNIDMQNRSANSGESYRIIAGPNAETTIKKSHGKNYANGHVFLKGKSAGIDITVGYSSGSKVWSNAYEKIPSFIKWCQRLAEKIVSDKEVKTNTGFDNLPIGRVVEKFPLTAHSATWHHETFSEAPFLLVSIEDELLYRHQLLDFTINILREESDLLQLSIDLIYDDIIIPLTYDFGHHFQYRIPQELRYLVEVNGHTLELIEYLNESPFQILLDDFGMVSNHEYFEPPREDEFQYPAEKILSHDWNKDGTDIKIEFYDDHQDKINNGNKASIHDALEIKLLSENYDILIYDHGTGEIADFISFKEYTERIEINLYHVKGSSGELPGDRVSDVYEVCMQAVKSQAWTTNKQTFKNKIRRRTENHPEKYLIGDLNMGLNMILKSKKVDFVFSIVQPGISQETFSPKLSYILAASDDYITNNGYEPLVVIGS